MNIFSFFLTLVVATIGGLIFQKLKAPAGALLGAMFFTALFNVATGYVFIPTGARLYIRIFTGAFVGAGMKKSDIIRLKTIAFPAVLLVLGMLLLNFVLGYGIHGLTGLDLTTAMLGSAPAGVQEMTLMAESFGANVAQIAVLQTVRIFAVVGFMPSLLSIFIKNYSRLHEEKVSTPAHYPALSTVAAPIDISSLTGDVTDKETPEAPAKCLQGDSFEKFKKDTLCFIRTIVIAIIGGLLLNMTPLPAGSMIGAMLATILATFFIKPSYFPNKVRSIIQICAGALIGSSIGLTEIISLAEIIVPVLILVAVLFVSNFIFGIVIHKITKLDIVTCLFASAAGGVLEMALIADEFGADSAKVTVLHLIRLICIILISPALIMLLTSSW